MPWAQVVAPARERVGPCVVAVRDGRAGVVFPSPRNPPLVCAPVPRLFEWDVDAVSHAWALLAAEQHIRETNCSIVEGERAPLPVQTITCGNRFFTRNNRHSTHAGCDAMIASAKKESITVELSLRPVGADDDSTIDALRVMFPHAQPVSS